MAVETAEVYPSSLEPTVAAYARHADLVIVRAPRRRGASTRASIIEGALIGGGAPVLLAPAAWTPTTVGRRVVIAWDGGREAARAAHDALDLLDKDAEIFVVTISDAGEHEEVEPHLDFAAHLARHGFKAERRDVQKRELTVPGTLQKAAVDLGADLVVMGGYRHSRVQQTLIGGVTRTMMHSGALPVLFSH
jgi:nucleotide-binding universal stress UspA family protein